MIRIYAGEAWICTVLVLGRGREVGKLGLREMARIEHEHWTFAMVDGAVHNSCVRGLWTGCTRLIRGKLKKREFD
jgi:hypothetical protein